MGRFRHGGRMTNTTYTVDFNGRPVHIGTSIRDAWVVYRAFRTVPGASSVRAERPDGTIRERNRMVAWDGEITFEAPAAYTTAAV